MFERFRVETGKEDNFVVIILIPKDFGTCFEVFNRKLKKKKKKSIDHLVLTVYIDL